MTTSNTHSNIPKSPEVDRLQAAALKFLAMRQEEEADERAPAHKSTTHPGDPSTPSTAAEMFNQTEAEPGETRITANCDVSTISGAAQAQTSHVNWQRLGKEQEVAPFPVIHMAYLEPTHGWLAATRSKMGTNGRSAWRWSSGTKGTAITSRMATSVNLCIAEIKGTRRNCYAIK